MNRFSRSMLWVILVVFAVVLSACGGGGADAEQNNDGAVKEAETSDALVITEEMVASGVEMKLGSEAVVKFDPAYNWDIITTPSLVIDAVPDAVLNEGEQVRLVAKMNGTAVIQATGRALCKQDNPPCETPSKQINVKVKVAP